MPPVVLGLGMHFRVAIALRRRRMQEFRPIFLRDIERVASPHRTRHQGLDTQPAVVDRARRRCEIEYIVNPPWIEGLTDILLQKFETGFMPKMFDVFL